MSFLSNQSISHGDFLEIAIRGISKARLSVLGRLAADGHLEKRSDLVSMNGFLLLHSVVFNRRCSIKLKRLLENRFLVPPTSEPLESLTLPDSMMNLTDFLSCTNTAPQRKSGILEVVFAGNECCSWGYLFKFAHTEEPFVLLFDVESSRQYRTGDTHAVVVQTDAPVGVDKTKFAMSDFPEGGKRASKFMEIVDAAKAWGSSKVVEGSLLQALREDKFLYVYVNTATDSPTCAVGDHTMQLGEGDSKRLLSVFSYLNRFEQSSSRAS